jgi:hypothetical protein
MKLSKAIHDEFIYYIKCVDGIRGVCLCPNSSDLFISYVWELGISINQLYVNKAENGASGVAQMVKSHPSKFEALSSTLALPKNKKNWKKIFF